VWRLAHFVSRRNSKENERISCQIAFGLEVQQRTVLKMALKGETKMKKYFRKSNIFLKIEKKTVL
jgi:hypothetical protein